MHKNTLNALNRQGDFYGRVVTIWGDHMWRGHVGKIKNIILPRQIEIRLENGTVTLADHRMVALGDNRQ